MADIFDEINEDLKRDQMQELWSRYGKYVIIAVSLVVIGVGARQGYTAWQDRQATEAAAIYHQALKADDSASALTAQLDTLSPGYAMLAQFRIAATQAENKDFDAAEASYLALSTDPDVKPLYQQARTVAQRRRPERDRAPLHHRRRGTSFHNEPIRLLRSPKIQLLGGR